MDRPIYFDCQRSRVAVEINNKTGDDLLTTKVPPVKSIGAQMLPEHSFGWRHLAA